MKNSAGILIDETIEGSYLVGLIHKGIFQLTQYEGPDERGTFDSMMLGKKSVTRLIEVLQTALATGDLEDQD